MSTIKTISLQHLNGTSPNLTLDANGNMTCAGTVVGANPLGGMRNRIINGDMRIDQRNGGAAITPTSNQYSVDRFYLFMSQSSKLTGQKTPSATETGYAVRLAAGFTDYLQVTIAATATLGASDCFGLAQRIEGFNWADMAWGTSGAKTVTMSFWVKSSVTGTFGVGIQNGILNRSYPSTYTINSANTWEYKTVVIPGDTTGTWAIDSSSGPAVHWSFGAGSNYLGAAGSWNGNNNNGATGQTSLMGTLGATWCITGVQLEVGSVATPFERRMYETELKLCERYYELCLGGIYVGNSVNGKYYGGTTDFRVVKRAVPTVTRISEVGSGLVNTPYSENTSVYGFRAMALATGENANWTTIYSASAEL